MSDFTSPSTSGADGDIGRQRSATSVPKSSLFDRNDNPEERNRSTSDVPPTGASLDGAKKRSSISLKNSTSNNGSIKVPERSKVVFEADDPLNRASKLNADKVKKENLSIRVEDEPRIVSALVNAAKKQTTGSIFSVEIDISRTGTLGMGVKDLAENILCVSLLKRQNNKPGAGEEAGVRLGDIIYGVNFCPTRNGSRTLITIMREAIEKGKMLISLQGWRCHQLCSDPMPGMLFPRADEFIVQAYSLHRTGVFSDWERWNFIEIMLGYLSEEMELKKAEDKQEHEVLTTPPRRGGSGGGGGDNDASSGDAGAGEEEGSLTEAGSNGSGDLVGAKLRSSIRVNHMRSIDLEKNILQAKGLRTALCVRIVHTKSQDDAVVYVLRVEDVESGLQWVVQRRYRDFHALNEELTDITNFTKEIDFPKKRISIRKTAKIVEERIVNLEQYVRKLLHLLTLYATMDSAASKALRNLQNFLGVDSYLDPLHPPVVDDQRFLELMAYRFLSDFSSPACQQCVRFVNGVDLDSMAEEGADGYMPVLQYMRDALSEVEQFVQQQHQQQMMQSLAARQPSFTTDQLRSFVDKCIRRQVEAALYLPLRRTIIRIVYSYLAPKSQTMQRAMALLQQAPPSFFQVDDFIQETTVLPTAVKAFRRVIEAYLPADQGYLLVKAANAVLELHKECVQEARRKKENNRLTLRLVKKNADDIAERAFSISGPDSYAFDGEGEGGRGVEMSVANAMTNGNVSPLSSMSSTGGSGGPNARHSAAVRDAINAGPVDGGGGGGGFSTDRSKVRSVSNSARSTSGVGKGGASPLGGTTNRQSASLMMYEMKSGSTLPDLMSKAALSDPVGLMFQATDTQPPPAVSRSTSGIISPQGSGVISNSFADDSTPQGSNRVTFNLAAPSAATRSLLSSTVKDTTHNPDLETIGTAIVSEHLASLLDEGGTMGGAGSGGGYDIDTAPTTPLAPNSSMNVRGPSSPRGMLASSIDSTGTSSSFLLSKLSTHNDRLQHATAGDSDDEASLASATPRNISTVSASGAGTKVRGGIAAAAAAGHDEDEDSEAAKEALKEQLKESAISADDFLPLFTYALVQAGFPQLMLVKELMVMLIDDEDSYGECGYYLATLEAATQHILDLAEQYRTVASVDQMFDNGQDIYDDEELVD